MEMKKIVLIDIDGCLSDYHNPLFLDLIENEIGKVYSSKEQIVDDLGISQYKFYKNKLRTEGLKLDYKLKSSSNKVLKFLKDNGFEIWINTSRPNIGINHQVTIKWLKKNNVIFDHIIFTGKKGDFLLVN